MRVRHVMAGAALAAAVLVAAGTALAQKQGGTLKIYVMDNPPSASIHEEATISTVMPFMGLYNNLVYFDPNKPKNALDSIIPELAKSWAWTRPRPS